MTPGEGQAWKSHSRFPHLQTSGYYGVDDFLPSLLANHEMGTTVEPGALETCNQEKSSKTALLNRTRTQRIPSRLGALCSNEGRIHLRRPSCHFRFSLATKRRTIHSCLPVIHPQSLAKLLPTSRLRVSLSGTRGSAECRNCLVFGARTHTHNRSSHDSATPLPETRDWLGR